MKPTSLIVEKGDDALLWGRVTYEDNLLVDSAATLDELKVKMQTLLHDFHGLNDTEFEVAYDLSVFFEVHDYLKISKIAEYAQMSPSLLRHYSAGSKNPSAEQAKRIEDAIHRLAQELSTVAIAA